MPNGDIVTMEDNPMKTYLLPAVLSVIVFTMLFQVSPARADTYECTRLTLADDGITVTEIEMIPCPAAIPLYSITEDDRAGLVPSTVIAYAASPCATYTPPL